MPAADRGAAAWSDVVGRAYLFMREWVVYLTPPVLLTCDEPAVLIGGPGLPRTERPGMGTASVAAFPRAPDAVLAMFRPGLVPAG